MIATRRISWIAKSRAVLQLGVNRRQESKVCFSQDKEPCDSLFEQSLFRKLHTMMQRRKTVHEYRRSFILLLSEMTCRKMKNKK